MLIYIVGLNLTEDEDIAFTDKKKAEEYFNLLTNKYFKHVLTSSTFRTVELITDEFMELTLQPKEQQ